MEQQYYTCVTNDRVIIHSDIDHKTTIMPGELKSLITCPITCDYFKDPVLLSATGHTYERSAIIKWLAERNNDPLTGVVITDTHIIPNLMLKALLYRLEVNGDDLVFHDFECEWRLVQMQAESQYPVEDVYAHASWCWGKPELFHLKINGDSSYIDLSSKYVSVKNIHNELSIDAIEKMVKYYDNKIFIVESLVAKVPGLELIPRPKYEHTELLRCPITGVSLHKPIINIDGISYDNSVIDMCKNCNEIGSTWFGKLALHQLCKSATFYENIIIRQITEIFNFEYNPTIVDLTTKLDDVTYNYWSRLKKYKKGQNMQLFVKHLRPEGNKERIWRNVLRAKEIINNKPHELSILNKFARKFLEKKDRKFYSNNNKLTAKRRELMLPHLNEDDTFGTDYSFLDLSGVVFTNTHFKDSTFCFTNLVNCRFDGCHFSYCNFIGANITGCVFTDCEMDDKEMLLDSVGKVLLKNQ
jgi:hypothetical protein